MEYLDTHEYNIKKSGRAPESAEAALILIHGRGGSALDILSIAEYLVSDAWYVAAPQATNNTWYPYGFMAPESSNEPWLTAAVNVVEKLMAEVLTQIPVEKLFLAGFSQGACLTLEVAARNARPYGGVICLTGGLIGDKIVPSKYTGNFEQSKILLTNGNNDPHVPLSRVEESEVVLKRLGGDVKTVVFPGRPHTILHEELELARSWIISV